MKERYMMICEEEREREMDQDVVSAINRTTKIDYVFVIFKNIDSVKLAKSELI
jgi:hypothetical protein